VYRVSKYRLPLCSPLCLPRVASSHSTPYHVPAVPSTGPMYLTVQTEPEKERRVPSAGGASVITLRKSYDEVGGQLIGGRKGRDSGTCGGRRNSPR
jgi:hypothetical protein